MVKANLVVALVVEEAEKVGLEMGEAVLVEGGSGLEGGLEEAPAHSANRMWGRSPRNHSNREPDV